MKFVTLSLLTSISLSVPVFASDNLDDEVSTSDVEVIDSSMFDDSTQEHSADDSIVDRRVGGGKSFGKAGGKSFSSGKGFNKGKGYSFGKSKGYNFGKSKGYKFGKNKGYNSGKGKSILSKGKHYSGGNKYISWGKHSYGGKKFSRPSIHKSYVSHKFNNDKYYPGHTKSCGFGWASGWNGYYEDCNKVISVPVYIYKDSQANTEYPVVMLKDQNFPVCGFEAIDPDGDGWGWENEQSCRVVYDFDGPQEFAFCQSTGSDPDGDGWGWENQQSCVVNYDSESSEFYPTCSSSQMDPDGDGWGWENEQSCVVYR